MKRILMRLVPLLLCAVLLLTACNKPTALEMDVKNNSFTNTKTGVTYLRAPSCYEAISVLKDRKVARVQYKGMDDLTLYEIEFSAPESMIATEEGELFYVQGMALPTVWDMQPERVYVGQVGGSLDFAVALIEEAEDIEALTQIYRDAVPFPEKEMLDDTLLRTRYDLRFYSRNYPSFYYCITYWQFSEDVLVYEVIDSIESFVPSYSNALDITFEEDGDELCAVYNFGKGILYDRDARLCYAVGNLVYSYLENEE